MKTNYTLVQGLLVAGIVTDWNKEIKDISEADKVEIQIDWATLTGTLNATVQILQRSSPDMNYVLADSVESVRTMDTALNSHLFSLPNWAGNDIKIVITKNGCTGGTISIGVGLKSFS